MESIKFTSTNIKVLYHWFFKLKMTLSPGFQSIHLYYTNPYGKIPEDVVVTFGCDENVYAKFLYEYRAK